MAMVEYRTVTVNSEADIIDEIMSFADDNGWDTYPGNGVIGRPDDDMFVRIWNMSDGIRIQGGRSYTGSGTSLGQQSNRYSMMTKSTILGNTWSPQGVLHLFAHEDPHAIYAIFNYSTDVYQWLCFGSIEKYGPFNGGQFYFGTAEQQNTVTTQAFSSDGSRTPNTPSAMLIGAWYSSGGYGAFRMYADIDEGQFSAYNGWANSLDFNTERWPHVYQVTQRSGYELMRPLHANSVNDWNAQTVFLPLWAFVRRPDVLHSLVGRVAGCRHLRAINFNREEEVTVGERTYKIFPWFQRRTDNTGMREWCTALEMPEP